MFTAGIIRCVQRTCSVLANPINAQSVYGYK